jgi:hypothetical protein
MRFRILTNSRPDDSFNVSPATRSQQLVLTPPPKAPIDALMARWNVVREPNLEAYGAAARPASRARHEVPTKEAHSERSEVVSEGPPNGNAASEPTLRESAAEPDPDCGAETTLDCCVKRADHSIKLSFGEHHQR